MVCLLPHLGWAQEPPKEPHTTADISCPAGLEVRERTKGDPTRSVHELYCVAPGRGGVREGPYRRVDSFADGQTVAIAGAYQGGRMSGRWQCEMGGSKVEAILDKDDLNGRCRVWDSKQLVEECDFLHSKKNGIWRRLYPDETVAVEVTMQDNEMHGLYRAYRTDSSLAEMRVYFEGKQIFRKDFGVEPGAPDPPGLPLKWKPDCFEMAAACLPRVKEILQPDSAKVQKRMIQKGMRRFGREAK